MKTKKMMRLGLAASIVFTLIITIFSTSCTQEVLEDNYCTECQYIHTYYYVNSGGDTIKWEPNRANPDSALISGATEYQLDSVAIKDPYRFIRIDTISSTTAPDYWVYFDNGGNGGDSTTVDSTNFSKLTDYNVFYTIKIAEIAGLDSLVFQPANQGQINSTVLYESTINPNRVVDTKEVLVAYKTTTSTTTTYPQHDTTYTVPGYSYDSTVYTSKIVPESYGTDRYVYYQKTHYEKDSISGMSYISSIDPAVWTLNGIVVAPFDTTVLKELSSVLYSYKDPLSSNSDGFYIWSTITNTYATIIPAHTVTDSSIMKVVVPTQTITKTITDTVVVVKVDTSRVQTYYTTDTNGDIYWNVVYIDSNGKATGGNSYLLANTVDYYQYLSPAKQETLMFKFVNKQLYTKQLLYNLQTSKGDPTIVSGNQIPKIAGVPSALQTVYNYVKP